ncbi:helix-turn-helix domain-containing protein [Catellatospora citrea]|uniref:Transcriptional regulator n=1 Tax=Catellatospora citrea TaxID=53366 RepID=A0A8J3KEF9_9ACTN|nr:helix-turn-helix transcriptional regulator [Catellatospora citrea]RKE06557.1 helix-turn-helix protein [Catellatospora citrea]GIF98551.1 transcriptional regulator [Catellatospora citrea]
MDRYDESMCRLFGAALRRLRVQAGISLRELGRRCLYDYSRISRVERGEHLINAALVPALDRALDAGGLLTSLRSLMPEPGDAAAPSAFGRIAAIHEVGGDTVELELSSPGGRMIRVNLPRREFNGLLTAGVLRALLPDGLIDLDQVERISGAINSPQRTDAQVLGYFRALLTQHYTADKALGPRHLVEVVLTQIAVLDKLRYGSRPGTAEPAMRLLAQYAEFAGWLYQDLGNTAAAMHWTDQAGQRAQAIGDHQLAAYLLVRRSNIALLDHDAVDVIELAAAARRMPAISPKLAALAAQQEARGWALNTETDRFRRLIDSAADLLLDHPDGVDDDAPVYLHSYDVETLDEQSASGYRACGQPETAVAILERRITATPIDQHRDRAHQLAKLANAVLQTRQPDPERAADIGLSCIDSARSTGSARISKELRTLDQALSHRWPDLAGTRQLREALTFA